LSALLHCGRLCWLGRSRTLADTLADTLTRWRERRGRMERMHNTEPDTDSTEEVNGNGLAVNCC